MPKQERGDDPGDHREDQISLAEGLPLNRSGRCTLRIHTAATTPIKTSVAKTSTRNANQP